MSVETRTHQCGTTSGIDAVMNIRAAWRLVSERLCPYLFAPASATNLLFLDRIGPEARTRTPRLFIKVSGPAYESGDLAMSAAPH